ncbi:hypothetical protein [Azotobacter chroococcum]|uniref:Uncharacterized protein n=1 Tax=Azotobacter chroococcum TaxID=353 RepID=A0AAQ0C169_9GAMM|nr:hypothetical protein [Azotobacter chroococcum]QQE90495.1 hypothetical protein GKQ51_09575 [Azotobacter chroococcum]
MIQYPEGLPMPLREGYSFQAVSPLLRSDLESGRSRQRRLYTSVPTMVGVSWLLSGVQAQLFEAWWEDALISGSQWFECPLKTPEGIQRYVARFTDIYSGPNLTGRSHWRFTAELELRERPILAPGWGSILPDYILGSEIFDRAMNQGWPQ